MNSTLLEIGRLTVGQGAKQAVAVSKALGDAKDMTKVRKAPVPGYRWSKLDEPTAVEGGEGFKQAMPAAGNPNWKPDPAAFTNRNSPPRAEANMRVWPAAPDANFQPAPFSLSPPPAPPVRPVAPARPAPAVKRAPYAISNRTTAGAAPLPGVAGIPTAPAVPVGVISNTNMPRMSAAPAPRPLPRGLQGARQFVSGVPAAPAPVPAATTPQPGNGGMWSNAIKGTWNQGMGGHNYVLGRFTSGLAGGVQGLRTGGGGWAAGKARAINDYVRMNEAQRNLGNAQVDDSNMKFMGALAGTPGVEAVGRGLARIRGGGEAAEIFSRDHNAETNLLRAGNTALPDARAKYEAADRAYEGRTATSAPMAPIQASVAPAAPSVAGLNSPSALQAKAMASGALGAPAAPEPSVGQQAMQDMNAARAVSVPQPAGVKQELAPLPEPASSPSPSSSPVPPAPPATERGLLSLNPADARQPQVMPAEKPLLALNPADARQPNVPDVPQFAPPPAAPRPRPPSILVGGAEWKPGGNTGAAMSSGPAPVPSYSDPIPGARTSLRTAWGTRTPGIKAAGLTKQANPLRAIIGAIRLSKAFGQAGRAVAGAGRFLSARPGLSQGLKDVVGGAPGAAFGWYTTPYFQPDLSEGNMRTARTLNALFGYMMGRGGVRGLGFGPKLPKGQGFTAGASGMLLTNPPINAINEVEKSFKAMPESIEQAGKSVETASREQGQAVGRKLLLAAGILAAGGLGATGYQALRDRKQDMARKGTIRVTLPTKRPGDVESTVDMPLDVLSNGAYKGIMRDTRRRVRAENTERIQRKGLALPAMQAGADVYDSFAEPA